MKKSPMLFLAGITTGVLALVGCENKGKRSVPG